MGSRPGNTQVILYVILVFVLASLISLVAGFLNPRKPLTPRLLLASVALWLLAGTFLVVLTDPAMPKDPLMTLQFVALLVAPALLPLAAWALARWKFAPPCEASALPPVGEFSIFSMGSSDNRG